MRNLEESKVTRNFELLINNLPLSNDERTYFMRQAVEMYLLDEEEREVKDENYTGKLYLSRRLVSCGNYLGRQFSADVESEKCRTTLSFLVAEQTPGMHKYN